jgi:hypothetical protein
MKTSFENFVDNIDNHTMVKNVAEIMHFELSKLSKKSQIEYLEDLLGELSRSSLKTYFDDLGCLEAYIEQQNDAIEFEKAAS